MWSWREEVNGDEDDTVEFGPQTNRVSHAGLCTCLVWTVAIKNDSKKFISVFGPSAVG